MEKSAVKIKKASPGMILFIIIMVTMAGVAQVFIKSGVNFIKSPEQLGGFPSNLSEFFVMVFYWQVFLGLCFYFVFGLAWLKILSSVPVSFAFPFLAISYIVIILGSYLFLNEPINALKLTSIVLIILGVVSLSRSDTTESVQSSR
ncbi:MAG TPA: hypothetical protein VGB30_10040 [bacterium]|jgi:drug/metabolite transporter (DMT)-like permease